MLLLLLAGPVAGREGEGVGEGWPQSVHAPAAAICRFQHERWKAAEQEGHDVVGVTWQLGGRQKDTVGTGWVVGGQYVRTGVQGMCKLQRRNELYDI